MSRRDESDPTANASKERQHVAYIYLEGIQGGEALGALPNSFA